jgi:pyruvate, water dikinase
MMKAILFSVLFLLLQDVCNAQSKYFSQDYLLAIPSKTEFDQLKGAPLSNLYSGIECVKICYNIASEKVYYINSTRFRFHIDFCEKTFGDAGEIREFNKLNYSDNPDRKYILAVINYYKSQQIYTLEFVSEDDVPVANLQKMYSHIKQTVGIKTPIQLLANNAYLLDKQSAIKDIPIIFPEQIFKNQIYQALVLGNTQGYARRIKNLSQQMNTVKENDIIFFDGTPLALPNCRAVVTSSMQTPLSHINVLCNNRKTPACAYSIFDSVLTAKKLWDKPIQINVRNNELIIKEIAETDLVQNKKSLKKTILLVSDVNTQTLQIFSKPKNITAKNIGSKAFGVHRLYQIKKLHPQLFEVPAGAFGIPFYYYKQHMQNASVQMQYKKLLRIPAEFTDSINKQLNKLRKAIKQQSVDPNLIALVAHQIKQTDSIASFRFRSSSNAEDIEGFNGAGLYESYSGGLVNPNKTIEHAIRKVWASVWNENAYLERSLFGIDHRTVMMGILVHKGFPAEEANGVAITKNMFRNDFPGFTINVQAGEVSVVQAADSITCDQFVCFSSDYFIAESGEVYEQYITRSNINNGKNVLTHKQVAELVAALDAIKTNFYFKHPKYYTKYSFDDFALDLEFKFDDDKLFIKQVRTFK